MELLCSLCCCGLKLSESLPAGYTELLVLQNLRKLMKLYQRTLGLQIKHCVAAKQPWVLLYIICGCCILGYVQDENLPLQH